MHCCNRISVMAIAEMSRYGVCSVCMRWLIHSNFIGRLFKQFLKDGNYQILILQCELMGQEIDHENDV